VGSAVGGCFFVGAIAEPTIARGRHADALVQTCKDWIDTLATAAASRSARATFAPTSIPTSSRFESTASCSDFNTYQKFLRESASLDRARESLERLLGDARARQRVRR